MRSEWTCCNQVFDRPGLVEHLEQAHGIKRPMQATQRQVSHIDATEFFQSTYDVEIGGLTIKLVVWSERSADDPMRA
jgi:hypothetical protein